MSSLTTENALRRQLRQHRQQLDLLTNTFTAADLRLVLVDSLQKLDALQFNEGEKKTSNVGSNAGGPQPKTMEELRESVQTQKKTKLMLSSKCGSNNAKKTDHEGGGGGGRALTTLAHVLLILKFLPRTFVHNLVSFTSAPQTSRLLTTCTELYVAEKVVLQKLPKVCDMKSFFKKTGKMFRLMVGVPNSRWTEWLDMSGVEELKLPRSVKDEEMLIMFSGERFSKLRTLSLLGCRNITDASVSEVARRCSNLQSLNVSGSCSSPSRITDASVLEVARRCLKLQSLDLAFCRNITDASVLEVARKCSDLQTLNLGGCSNITDASLLEIARGCTNLKTFSAPSCITDDSLREVARRCSNLRTLNLGGCRNITDASVLEVARRCLNLQKLDLNHCSYITDASLLGLARGCSNLQWLCLRFCRNITYACKMNALRQSQSKLQLNWD